jgi:hypothetical protein
MPVEPSSLAYSIGALTADATNKSVSVEDALSGALRAVVVLLAARRGRVDAGRLDR